MKNTEKTVAELIVGRAELTVGRIYARKLHLLFFDFQLARDRLRARPAELTHGSDMLSFSSGGLGIQSSFCARLEDIS